MRRLFPTTEHNDFFMKRFLLILSTTTTLMLLLGAAASAGQLHWVGNGTGAGKNWNKSSNWSLNQGGTGGAGIPTASDDVFIDGGAGSLQINVSAVCQSFTQTLSSQLTHFSPGSSLTVGSGGFNVSAGTFTLDSGNTITDNGNWNVTGGTFNAVNGTVVLSGAVLQSIAGSPVFNHLTLSNAAGATLLSGIIVNGTLTLTAGTLSTGSNQVVLGSTGAVVRTAGYVNGHLTKVVGTGPVSLNFEIGDASTYAPVGIVFNNVTTAGTLTASTTSGDHPALASSAIDPSKSVNRYWTLTNSGAAFDSYSATFNFASADLDPGADPGAFIPQQYTAGAWSSSAAGVRTSTSTQMNGLTSFGDFALGDPASFTISASAGPNGSISPSGTISVAPGASQSFTISPDQGYHVDSVIVDGLNHGALTTYTFNTLSANHTISASFSIDQFTIAASAGPDGSISPAGSVNVNYGGSQSFTISPNAGYHVDSLLVDGVNQGALTTYAFNSVTANHTISATFSIDQFTIVASAGANGSITPAGSITVDYGSDQSFVFSPNAGYHVDSVVVDGVNQGPAAGYLFSHLTAPHTIHVSFAIDRFSVNATAGANGQISPAGTLSVVYGDSVSFSIVPNTGYHISDVVVDGGSVGPVSSYTFLNVTASHTITASFTIDGYTITAASGPNGSISPSGAVGIGYGADTTFTFDPSVGYHIDSVIVDGVFAGRMASYTFTAVSSNHTIAVKFGLNTYEITATAGSNGTISPAGVVTVGYGASQEFTIAAGAGYHIADVLVDSSSVGAVATFQFTNVTSNHTIAAEFAPNPPLTHTITASAGMHGHITPSGVIVLNDGQSQSFSIVPDTGYFIADVHVDSSSVGAVSSYNFDSVKTNHTIAAFFDTLRYSISATAGSHGSISPSGNVIVTYGSGKTFTITPDTGYFISDVHVDSVSVGAVAAYTFADVRAHHSIEASFAQVNYPPSAPLLVTPQNHDTVWLNGGPVSLTFGWHRSVDPNAQDTLVYRLIVAGPGGDTTITGLHDTVKTVDLSGRLQPGALYSWTVSVNDGLHNVASADTFFFVTRLTTGVKDHGRSVPRTYALYQNYPNPFNPTTRIRFDVPRASEITLKLYTVNGQEVVTLLDRVSFDPGVQEVEMNGSGLASGVYLYRVTAHGSDGTTFLAVKKLMLIK